MLDSDKVFIYGEYFIGWILWKKKGAHPVGQYCSEKGTSSSNAPNVERARSGDVPTAEIRASLTHAKFVVLKGHRWERWEKS